MHYAIVKGSVVASCKVESLKGIALKILLPCNAHREAVGDSLIAVDAIGAREGDLVMWVGKREASLALPGVTLKNDFPVDAAVTGIIDDIG